MHDLGFWASLLETYRTLPDWLKLAWLVVPPAFVLAAAALTLRARERRKPANALYTIHQDDGSKLRMRRTGSDWEREVALVLVKDDQPD